MHSIDKTSPGPIHIIGSNGFIGQAIQRLSYQTDIRCWSHSSNSPDTYFNLFDRSSRSELISNNPTRAILLTWPGLPNYSEDFHLTQNLPACIDLIKTLYDHGLKHLVCAGTCYEYGLKNGALSEVEPVDPANCYSIAKDALRRVLFSKYSNMDIQICWARIFYPFGTGQNPNSLIPSIDQAIRDNKPFFELNSWSQIRDFIPVNEVARMLLLLSEPSTPPGIYNIGSGSPLSIREFLEDYIAKLKSPIRLVPSTSSPRSYESMAFWADTSKITSLINSRP